MRKLRLKVIKLGSSGVILELGPVWLQTLCFLQLVVFVMAKIIYFTPRWVTVKYDSTYHNHLKLVSRKSTKRNKKLNHFNNRQNDVKHIWSIQRHCTLAPKIATCQANVCEPRWEEIAQPICRACQGLEMVEVRWLYLHCIISRACHNIAGASSCSLLRADSTSSI